MRDKRRLQVHPLYCNGPELLVDRNRGLCEDRGFEFHCSLAIAMRKDFEFCTVNFFFRWNEIYRRRFSRYYPICFQERAVFPLRRSSMAYMLQRNTKNFLLRKDTFYINIRPFTTIMNSDMPIKLRFISDLKKKKNMNNSNVKLNFGVIHKQSKYFKKWFL